MQTVKNEINKSHNMYVLIIHRKTNNSYQLCTLLLSKWKSIMCLVPRAEWCAIDADNAVLHKSLCTYELIITGIVQHVNDSCLACYG